MQKIIYIIITWLILILINIIECRIESLPEILISIIILFNYIIILRYNEEDLTLEFKILYLLNLLSIFIIIWSKDIISIYVGLEGYSFSIYYIIVTRLTNNRKKIGLIYIILNSLSSLSILYNIYLLILEYNLILIPILNEYRDTKISGDFFLFGILFKLGIFPYIQIYLNLYKEITKGVLYYILILPTFFNFYLIYKFNNLLYFNEKILIILGLISIIYAIIKGIATKTVNSIIIYSSLFNSSYFLVSLVQNIENLKDIGRNLLLPFYLYSLQINLLFLIVFLFIRKSYIINNYFIKNFPFFSLSLMILSFIGIPPLSGFYLKLYLLYPIIANQDWKIIIILISNILAALLYFKLIIPSSSFSLKSFSLKEDREENNNIIISKIEWSYLIIILLSNIIIFYPFFIGILYVWFIEN